MNSLHTLHVDEVAGEMSESCRSKHNNYAAFLCCKKCLFSVILPRHATDYTTHVN